MCGGQNTPCIRSFGEGAIINVVANMLCTRKYKESRVAVVVRAGITRRQSAFVYASFDTQPPIFSTARLINARTTDD